MSTPTFFTDLYQARNPEIAAFGAAWCGPSRYEHGEDVLIARYSGDGDGQPVEVYVCAMPARFYRIRVLAAVDYQGRAKAPWELATGSGMAVLAGEMAAAIAGGMLANK